MPAEQVVAVIARAYYDGAHRLKPLMEIIERAHPGIVELSGSTERPGFAIRLAERPFPKRYEAELRQGVQAMLVGGFADDPSVSVPQPSGAKPGVITRLLRAIRRLFRA